MPKGRSFVASVRRELEEAFMKEIERQKAVERGRMLGMQKTNLQRQLQDERRAQQQNEQLLREDQLREQREQEAVRQLNRQRMHER